MQILGIINETNLLCFAEWTIIQLTSQFNIHEMNINDDKMYTNPLHISVFNCGMPQCEPFCITVDAPKCVVDGKNVEVCEEMSSIIQRNRDILGSVTTSKHFSSCRDKKAYKDARENLNCRLKVSSASALFNFYLTFITNHLYIFINPKTLYFVESCKRHTRYLAEYLEMFIYW